MSIYGVLDEGIIDLYNKYKKRKEKENEKDKPYYERLYNDFVEFIQGKWQNDCNLISLFSSSNVKDTDLIKAFVNSDKKLIINNLARELRVYIEDDDDKKFIISGPLQNQEKSGNEFIVVIRPLDIYKEAVFIYKNKIYTLIPEGKKGCQKFHSFEGLKSKYNKLSKENLDKIKKLDQEKGNNLF